MKAKVYFSEQISPEKVVELYKAVGLELPGKVAVKVQLRRTGQPELSDARVLAADGRGRTRHYR